MINFKTSYKENVAKKLQEKFGYKSVMQVPKITKITLNMGVGAAALNKDLIKDAVSDLELISGQKPVVTLSRKAIAGFKIRENWPIGCKVTLRRDRMYQFLERLVKIYLPRVRDFRGVSKKSFDGMGNYSLGIKEQIVCPEIDYDKISAIRGFDITITTTAKSDKEALALLESFEFPFY